MKTNVNQARFSIEDGIYEAKSKTELISLGYDQAKVKKSKRYNEDSFWEEFVYFFTDYEAKSRCMPCVIRTWKLVF